ncbi:uncharacterized protein LOC144111257 isoform X3 [Amblyomma americanum]
MWLAVLTTWTLLAVLTTWLVLVRHLMEQTGCLPVVPDTVSGMYAYVPANVVNPGKPAQRNT